jgi:hypothetical protein
MLLQVILSYKQRTLEVKRLLLRCLKTMLRRWKTLILHSRHIRFNRRINIRLAIHKISHKKAGLRIG